MTSELLRDWISPKHRGIGHWVCLADTVSKQQQCPAYIPCKDRDLPEKAERGSCVHCKSGISDICSAA